MNYIRSEADGQLAFAEITESLMIPSMLYGFHNTSTEMNNSQAYQRNRLMPPGYYSYQYIDLERFLLSNKMILTDTQKPN